MKTTLLSILIVISQYAAAQSNIDLKTLIEKPVDVALRQLSTWGVKVSPSTEYKNLWIGYDGGIEMEVADSVVTTIWIKFKNRRTGNFPFQVDNIIKPNTDINTLISTYGKPHETSDEFENGMTDSAGWVKWNTKEWQLHCHVDEFKIVMVTLMEPDWYPGK